MKILESEIKGKAYTFKVYFPIIFPFQYADAPPVYDILNEICTCPAWLLNEVDAYKDVITVKISHIKKLSSKYMEIYRHNIRKSYGISDKEWLKFEVKCTLNSDKWNTIEVQKFNEDRELIKMEASDEENLFYRIFSIFRTLDQSAAFLTLATNIAYPYYFQLGTGIALINSSFFNERKGIYSHLDPYEMEDTTWPKLHKLDIKSVWYWLKKQPGVFDGLSSCRIGRAINAFSYLFNDDTSFTLNLLWCMVGLEAIYVTNNNTSKLVQLIKNSEQLIGHSAESTNMIKRMYDLRSRFFHGERNMPNKFNNSDDDVTEFEEALYEITDNAIAMLISTLQATFLKQIGK